MLFRALFVFLVVIMINMAYTIPMADDDSGEELFPAPRVTCDVLSFSFGGFNAGSSACALNCIGKGKKGGSCNSKKVCVCRN